MFFSSNKNIDIYVNTVKAINAINDAIKFAEDNNHRNMIIILEDEKEKNKQRLASINEKCKMK